MRTKKIHLVLVTTLLASCNRMIIPCQYPPVNTVDSTLAFYLPWNFPPYPPPIYHRQVFWQNHRFVIKGGFGRAVAAAA